MLSGEALLVIDGEERRLRPWDFVHCPSGTNHTIVGAGTAPCLVLAVGARDRSVGSEWGAYTVDNAARRHGAGSSTRPPSRARRTRGSRQASSLATATPGYAPNTESRHCRSEEFFSGS